MDEKQVAVVFGESTGKGSVSYRDVKVVGVGRVEVRFAEEMKAQWLDLEDLDIDAEKMKKRASEGMEAVVVELARMGEGDANLGTGMGWRVRLEGVRGGILMYVVIDLRGVTSGRKVGEGEDGENVGLVIERVLRKQGWDL